ncbi:hypothetical protein EDB89DRAFT_1907837 [Lactarius sanguifluus]|nr:hypothetical protein EDB89DRAFT_1907837 [Lactarius sanguifluus]
MTKINGGGKARAAVLVPATVAGGSTFRATSHAAGHVSCAMTVSRDVVAGRAAATSRRVLRAGVSVVVDLRVANGAGGRDSRGLRERWDAPLAEEEAWRAKERKTTGAGWIQA